jgi:hypothetical protein
LTVPHPVNGTLYLKLRDDPEIVQTLTMPVTPIGPPPAPVAAESKAAEPKADAKPVDSPAKPEAKPDTKVQHEEQ